MKWKYAVGILREFGRKDIAILSQDNEHLVDLLLFTIVLELNKLVVEFALEHAQIWVEYCLGLMSFFL